MSQNWWLVRKHPIRSSYLRLFVFAINVGKAGLRFWLNVTILNRPAFDETVRFKSGHHCCVLTGELPVVICLAFCWRYVPNGFEQTVVIEPRKPFERRELHGLLCLPWRSVVNQLGLVEPVDGLGQGIGIAVAFTAHRRLNARFDQSLGVADADVLRAAVGVTDEAYIAPWLSRV